MTIRVRVQGPVGPATDYDLEGPEIVIGRAAGAAIVIADSRVSRQHARLVLRDGIWWVEDMGARNRALLDGTPVERAARLRPGARLEIGDSILRLIGEEDADESARATGAVDVATAVAAFPGGGRDAARMWTIHEIHRALAGTPSLSELLDLILARCFDMLQPEEGAIMLRAPNGTLANAASRRLGPGGGPVTVPRRLVDEVAGKSQPALVLDAAGDERFSGSQSIVSSGIRSIVAAPLVDAEGTLGLITLCSRIAVRQFTQADLDMLVSIASAVALRVRNVALADELAARRVIEHELALAHDVQMAMLPRPLPPRPELSLSAELKPARSVGGDLYDFVLDGDRLWFIVADVAGKSIAAALYMAIVRTLFRAVAHGVADVAEVVGRMNQELARDNDRLMFVTAAIGCLDVRSGALALVDAGHTPAVMVGDGPLTVAGVPKCMALGVVANAVYTSARLTLEPGVMLVVYTDGLTDARDTRGAMFGEDRLHQAIAAGRGGTPASLVAGVIGQVESFATGAPPEDDLTLLAIQYDGPAAVKR
jgi:serine phosphatase RsbU (regulator of sigma subunit)/pSer/pThr/pTyr-binding forkhead associated (FHA) protein